MWDFSRQFHEETPPHVIPLCPTILVTHSRSLSIDICIKDLSKE